MGRCKFILLALFFCISLFAGLSFAKESEKTEQQRIEGKIKGEGSAKVIIVLDSNGQNAALKSKKIIKTVSPETVSESLIDAKKFNIINAYAGVLTEEKLEELKAQGQNFRIYEDTPIYITLPKVENEPRIDTSLSTATSIVTANYSWNIRNITGRNISVAVIDTGIDYNHSALGGCFGNGCRVAGGYDFVNNDADPWDDNGHGTHVAGIIGANGSIKGVAPEVEFYALKACAASGSCDTSKILSAIDWAVNNSVDIISMSIGGYASSSYEGNSGKDVLSLAVDNTVDQGIVFVISAGNTGVGVSTINVPGAAAKAITVGAVNDADTLSYVDDGVASFSSRGPAAFGRLDPDISAPGVNIVSSIPGNTTGALSGTSMAAPFVSGAAALLIEEAIQQGSNLTPGQVRSILIGSSRNISGKLFEIGSGLLDIESALESNMLFYVNHTDTYLQSVSSDRWEFVAYQDEMQQANITIINNENYAINFVASQSLLQNLENTQTIASDLFSFDTSFSINNNSATVIQINFSLVNFSDYYSSTYGGVLLLNGTLNNGTSNLTKQIRIPIVVTKPVHVEASSVYLQRTMNNPPTIDAEYHNEDVYFYATYNPYFRNTSYMLNWSESGFDLDLYLYNSTGDLISASAVGAGISESVTTQNTHSLKWIRIDGYYFTSQVNFSHNVTDYSNPLSIQNYSVQQGNIIASANSSIQIDQTSTNLNNGLLYYYWSLNSSLNSTLQNFSFTTPSTQRSFYILNFLVSTSSLSNRTNSTLSWNISIDGVSPQVSISSPQGDFTNNSLPLNYQVTDDYSGINQCWYSVNLGSNVSLTNCSNSSVSLSTGFYNLTVYTNDSAGNIGYATANFSINDSLSPVISNTSPSGSFSSSTTQVTLYLNTNKNATCRYSPVDQAYDAMLNNFTSNLISHSATYTVSAGNSYIIYVRCADDSSNSNQNSTTISFSVSATATSGGNSRAGGSGVAKPDTRATITQTASIITSEYDMQLSSTQIALTKLNLTVNSEIRNVRFIIATIKNPEIKYEEDVYSYIQINHTNLEDSNIKKVAIEFQVNKTWIEKSNINPSDIVLVRYADKWSEIKTDLVKTDAKFAYYSATSPGLSLYAISVKKENDVPQINTTEVNETQGNDKKIIKDSTPRITENISLDNTTSKNQTLAASTASNKFILLTAIFVVLLLIFFGFLIYFLSIRKKKN